jgi:hypothetical protein
MATPLLLADVASLLKTDTATVEGLIASGRLHGIVKDGVWTTTREMLAADLDIMTDAARIERLRTNPTPAFALREDAPIWLTSDWVAASLLRVREMSRDE